MAKHKDELLNHDYDGIQEFDNDLPGWWKGLFYITIVFAFVYLTWWHVLGIGDTQEVKYEKSMNPAYVPLPEDQEQTLVDLVFPQFKAPYTKPGRELSQAEILGGVSLMPQEEVIEVEMDTDVEPVMVAAALADGKKIYDQYCFTCHGMAGEGGIGPNLTDDFWIHGGTFPDVVHTIRVGVPIKGMIAWERSLPKEDIVKVASYVWGMHGTSPPNAKAPQGEEFARQ